jgi:hypothetical protein
VTPRFGTIGSQSVDPVSISASRVGATITAIREYRPTLRVNADLPLRGSFDGSMSEHATGDARPPQAAGDVAPELTPLRDDSAESGPDRRDSHDGRR